MNEGGGRGENGRSYTEVLDAQADDRAEHDESTPRSLLELLVSEEGASPPPLACRIEGVVVGRIASVEGAAQVRVTFTGAPEDGFVARVMTSVGDEDRGREVALMFEGGDPRRPILMGKIMSPLATGENSVVADGRRVEINAAEEIVLRCGESSITLTRAGKIILRGAYLLSRSTGVNCIQGGSVEIN